MIDTTTRLVRRLLDEPRHIEALRSLDARHFCALVATATLEDSGELLAMATRDQTLAVLDQQIWRNDGDQPQEHLDPARFALWLEVMLEGGDALVAQRLSELPEELLTAGLSAQLFVLGLDALGHQMAGASWDEAELAERVLDECLHLELDRYTLVARHALGWDPTIAALLALDRVEHDLVQRVLARCHQATLEQLHDADDGLAPILRAQQTIEADALADREDRRARAGYVSRASAQSFLALAAQISPDDPGALDEDPVTRAYFRELDREPEVTAAWSRARGGPTPALSELLEHLDPVPSTAALPLALPAGIEATPEPPAVVAFREAMHALYAHDPRRHAEQLARLAYLANVLTAAGRPGDDPYDLLGASKDALAIAARGFEHSCTTPTSDDDAPWRRLQELGVDALFRVGWRLRRSSGPEV